jgi:glycosyltransferase involved in cell wall biosynthesis
MPKVLRIINRFNLGGPTYNAAYLSRYLSPEFEIKLIGGKPQIHEAHSGFILENLGVPYQEIGTFGRSISFLDDLKTFREIRKIIREFKPNIVHTHAAKAGAIGRMAAHMEKVPVVVHTFHGHVFDGYFSPWKSSLVQRTEQFLSSYSSAIVAISEKQKYDLTVKYRIAPEDKVHVIPLGMDLERFYSGTDLKRKMFRSKYKIDEDTICIGIIGRLTAIKNHELFLKSIVELKQITTKKIQAYIIGDGELMQELKDSCDRLSLIYNSDSNKNNDVVFTSWIKDIDSATAGLDIVALTSINEGTPVSLIEAQAASKVVITTHVGGVEDVMIEGKTGIIVQKNNDALAYAEQLKVLVEDATLCQRMGTAGKEWAMAKYNYPRLIQDMRALYFKLLSEKK